VLDEAGDFSVRCNLSMVELEPIKAEDDLHERLHHQGGDLETHGKVDIMQSMSKFDAERIFTLVSNHAAYTNSRRAREILDNWSAYLPRFVKVMPVEYRRALKDLEETEAGVPALVAGE
jgi:glutamate synthase (NADPH/NADH) large chain